MLEKSPTFWCCDDGSGLFLERSSKPMEKTDHILNSSANPANQDLFLNRARLLLARGGLLASLERPHKIMGAYVALGKSGVGEDPRVPFWAIGRKL